MDKYEYKVRADEIKSLIAEGEYAEAAKIADTIDWRRVKSIMMLCTISDLYKINRRYEDSRDILLLAYERHAGGRLIVYSLCELSIKLEEYVQAVEYYKEFVQLAPKDTGRYVLQYKLYEAQEVSLEERIAVLEELKKRDYRERWAYELASLYHRVGLETKCVEECDEMYLWFGEGRYVLKALELKKLHQPLTEEQEAKYEQMKQTGGIIESDFAAESNAIKEEAGRETEEEEDDEFSIKMNVLTDPTQKIPKKELDDIQVKTVDISQYNTINLQRELAESMKEFLDSHPTAQMPVEEVTDEMEQTKVYEPVSEEASSEEEPVQEEMIPEEESAQEEMEEAPRKSSVTPVYQDTDEMQLISEDMLNQPEEQEEKPVSEEVFFGNTAEVNIEDVVSELVEEDAGAARKAAYARNLKTEEKSSIGNFAASANPAVSNTGVIRTFHKPSGYDDILSQEYDGQLSLVVPEETKIEKQITGQLSIADVMAEWERMKKEKEQKMLAEIRERVHKQTDALFIDFDESTKSGLLEELERAMVDAAIKDSKKKSREESPKVIKISDMDRETSKEESTLEEDIQEALLAEKDEEITEETISADTSEEADNDGMDDAAEDMSADSAEAAADDSAKEDADDDIEELSADEDVEEAEDTEEEEAEKADVQSESATEKQEAEAGTAGEQPEADGSGTKEEEKSKEASEEKQENDSKYTAREMTQSEREQFAPFIHHKKTRRQIVEAIDNISMASYTGNVIITGEEGTGTTALAKLLVKEIQLSDNNFSGKVAKISGTNMNKKDIPATLSKMSGGALIVEGAAVMKKVSVETLVKELNQEGRGLIVLLEDKKESMDKFLNKHAALAPIFNLRVDVEALDDQTLVKYAKKYAQDQEYSIDDLGVLALHTRIAEMQTSDHEVTLAEIEELVDEAIYFADKKTPGHFFDVLLGKRYDEEDMIVLREKDFMHY